MSSYADIKKTVRASRDSKMNAYKNGGETSAKKSGTTVNIVVPSARGEAAQRAPLIAPGGGDMARAPSPMPSPPPAPMPPVGPQTAGQAGLAALGSPPQMAKGGKVKGGASVKSPMINISTSGPDAKKMRKAMEGAAMSELDKWGKKANGGKVAMKVGSGSALGRLEKAKHGKV